MKKEKLDSAGLPLISIIIPVFNIERWLPQCLEGVLKAAPTDSEIILVIGDSDDNSNILCETYAQADNRIRVSKQNGKGLANARNCGFDISRGKYIAYIDGDDSIEIELFAELIARIRALDSSFDLAMVDYNQVGANGKVIRHIYQIGDKNVEASGEMFLEHVLRRKQCFWNVWRYIYRREFLVQHGISFLEGRLSEDMDYIAKVYAARPRFIFFHCPFYNYRIGRGDSLMDRPTFKRLNDTVLNIEAGIEHVNKTNLPFSSIFIKQYQFEFILCMALCVEINSADRAKAYDLYKQKMRVLDAGQYLTAHFVKILFKVLPVSAGAWALHVIKIVKRKLLGDNRKVLDRGSC